MVNGSADGTEATQPGTGILAPAIDAGPVAGTLAVGYALGPAVGRNSQVLRQAAAHSVASLVAALGMGSTGRRQAGIDGFALDWDGMLSYHLTLDIGTSRVTRWADALRTVVDHVALGEVSTGTGTGVAALLVHAGQAGRTLWVTHTFRATQRRTSVIPRQAGAYGLGAHLPALSMGTAGRGLAGMGFGVRGLELLGLAQHKGIALIASRTLAQGHVIVDLTGGSRSTRSRTRVLATIADAGLVPRTLGAQYALGATTHVGITLVQGQAAADAVRTLGVGSTGRGLTGVFSQDGNRGWLR